MEHNIENVKKEGKIAYGARKILKIDLAGNIQTVQLENGNIIEAKIYSSKEPTKKEPTKQVEVVEVKKEEVKKEEVVKPKVEKPKPSYKKVKTPAPTKVEDIKNES